jgi:hypothetical protein
MARARGLAKTQYADVEMFGLDDFQRKLRRAPADVRKRVSQGSKRVAEHLVRDMRRRARTIPHARQYALVAPTLKALAGPKPKMKLGGSKRAGSGKGSKAGQFIYGVEFGSKRRRQTQADRWFSGPSRTYRNAGASTRQFPPHRGRKGYVIFPTITANHEFIKKAYTREIEKALRRVGD